jgi:hypothetical protein
MSQARPLKLQVFWADFREGLQKAIVISDPIQRVVFEMLDAEGVAVLRLQAGLEADCADV